MDIDYPFVDIKCVYVREIYKIFYDMILSELNSHQEARLPLRGMGTWVTGTPGVGKSTFLYYVAKQLVEELSERYKVVVTKNKHTYLWECDKFTVIGPDRRDSVLSERASVHLCDGKASQEHLAYMVFFVSPTIANIEPYHSKHLGRLYMPPWSEIELENLFENCFQQEFMLSVTASGVGLFLQYVMNMFQYPWNMNCTVLYMMKS